MKGIPVKPASTTGCPNIFIPILVKGVKTNAAVFI